MSIITLGWRECARGTWLVAAMLGCLGLPAAAQVTADAEISESQRRLEQIRRERGQLVGEASRATERAENLSGQIQVLGQDVVASTATLGSVDSELELRDAEIAQISRELIITRDALADRRSVLHTRLRTIYKRGPLHAVQVLLAAESFADLINRYKYLVLIARHDRQLVREVAALEDELMARERTLAQTLNTLQDMRSEGSIVLDELTGLRARQQQALVFAQSTAQSATERIAQLDADERALRAVLANLDRARVAGTGTNRPAATTLTTGDLGALAWPVQGSLLYRFGRATQANGSVIRWNGLGIGAPAGTDVRAVESGTVVMAGPFEGYGPTVIVSHGGGYYSLYLYLRQLSVRQGDAVARNTVVGTVGGQETPEGSHVEFQIRGPGGEALDPLEWLQSRASL